MKVYDILLEAPANYNSSAYVNSPYWDNKGKSTTNTGTSTSSSAPTTTTTTPSKGNTAKRVFKGPKTPTAKSTSKNPIARVYENAKKRALRNQKWLAGREKILGDKYGWKLKLLFRAFGIWAAITETWATTDVLDEMYQKGEIDETGLEEGREYAWGLFNMAVLAPAVTRILANTLLVTRLMRFLKNALAVVSAPASLGASIAAAAASEAFFIWLQKWIVSTDGQAFFKDYAYEIIRYFGKPTDAVANKLQQAWNKVQGKDDDYYSDAKKRKEKSTDGQGAQPADKGPPPAPQSTETWPRHIRYQDRNRIFVGGVKVTDDEGKLIVGVQNDLAVQGARAGARTLKLKDPLEDIPLHAGQPPIRPLL